MPHRHPPIQELSATHRNREPCHTDHVLTGNVFNPRILDASIRDVTSALSDEQKADILLHAMNHLKPERWVDLLLSNGCNVFFLYVAPYIATY